LAVPRTAGILKAFGNLPDPLREYLVHFPKLAEDFPWEVALSYLFAQVELAHNMTIYCGVVKCHRVDSELARKAINDHHMTRPRFRELYAIIINKKGIQADTTKRAVFAEGVRDRILHGKTVKDEEKRAAIISTLDYANLLNEQIFADANFRPFGKLQGFKGRGTPLDKSTSRWVLMGIGLLAVKKIKGEAGNLSSVDADS